MKKIFLLIMLAFFMVTSTVISTAEAAREVTVGTVDELMANIADDTVITIRPGTYNISHWLESNPNISSYWDYPPDSLRPQGVLSMGNSGVVFSQFKNLTLKGSDAGGAAEIVIEDPYANVLEFRVCENIQLQNLTLGHAVEKGLCDAGVVGLYGTKNVVLNNVDLYGCGAYGIVAQNSSNVRMIGGFIRECTYGCVQAFDVKNMVFTNVDFRDCSQYNLFPSSNSDVSFNNCRFVNLRGTLDMLIIEKAHL